MATQSAYARRIKKQAAQRSAKNDLIGEMLEALKDALMVLQSVAAADPTWTQAAMARDDVSAVIAKAEAKS